MIACCYNLRLTCDNRSAHVLPFSREYNDEYGSRCRQEARRDGWKFDIKTGAALCPKCTKEPLGATE